MEKSYRIHTNIIKDTVLNVNMQQDYDFLEVLSLKLRTSDTYRLHSSNYGVIIGRVLANDAFGIPNARVSVFIERGDNDPTYTESLYPYKEVLDTDKEGRRYNLLPDYSNDDCYRIVGTFPNKRLVLDDDVNLEIYDKYWKFTTVTNSAGDYMIFGVPSGNQQIHIDIDLSDIGILSQTPRDFTYKGYNMTMFDSPTQFKESTNLDGLAQIYSQNKSVFVYPFWGDEDLGNGIAAITRCDIQMQYKFEPTCVFMGAIFSDNEGNPIGHQCSASEDNGMNDQLITGEGTIEMIRKTTDGLVEEYSIQGNQLIDSNGVWCYQIPMNLDYIMTDEYGNIVPTDNPNKGIPTRTQVRFRISKYETGEEGSSSHTAKYLVPMNPTLVGNKPKTAENGAYIERMYKFGSETPDDCFRDLYWNNVYSVKNYIPKTQVSSRAAGKNYTGLKGSNHAKDQNVLPFNKLRIDIPFVYAILCILFYIVSVIVSVINEVINIINTLINTVNNLLNICLPFGIGCIFNFSWIPYVPCIPLGNGLSNDNTAFYPGCGDRGMQAASCPDDMPRCKKRASQSALMDLVEQKLAEDYKIVKLDFYQDWLNGSLYMPLWHWRKSKKKKFLFFTIKSAVNTYCDCNKTYSSLKSYVTCNINYTNKKLGVSSGSVPEGEDSWHRARTSRVNFPYGLIKAVENRDGLKAYYYTAIQPTASAGIMAMENRAQFEAFRLFATDIILLGNLNENNMYGLPQLFKVLPSTTVNIPPIASITESPEDSTDSDNVLFSEDSGVITTTGMDWLDGDGTPSYNEGLFMEITCTSSKTKAKSCINVERLCELGMSLDMKYDAPYPTSSGIRYGTFERDGFITKQELDDTENRAMFATMNHIGFVPQPYQSTKNNFNETQVLDENTNYYIPKFKFLYPTDLDGRMSPIIDRYRGDFKQIMTDKIDEAYINFRLGDVQPKVRGGQFYNGNSMPLYNNSFYFYFGIKKGNTAIEKFNKMFLAQCFKNSKKPFSLNITTRPKAYCQNIYRGDLGDSLINITSDDIQVPYSYELIDSDGLEISGDSNIEESGFSITSIDNGAYTLTITDVNGRHVSERINLDLDRISISYETRGLGTKYYDGSEDEPPSSRDDICNASEYYGKITFNKLFIDGYEFEIGSGTTLLGSEGTSGSNSFNVQVFAKTIQSNTDIFNTTTSDEGFYVADMRFEVNPSGDTEGCLCTNLDNNSFFTGYTIAEKSNANDPDKEIFVFGFKVFRPNGYLITLTQHVDGCVYEGDSGSSNNTSTFNATVENGKNFYAFLNKMPIKFMIDKGDDFYKPNNDEEHLRKWLNMHSEDAYKYPEYTATTIWKDFVNILDDKSEASAKRDILKYKFNTIFSLANAVYVREDGGNRFNYTAQGGVQPLLYRSFAPDYSDADYATSSFKYSDNNYVTINPDYPNIVGDNYRDIDNLVITNKARINNFYKGSNRERLGNYFMVATNNGRYINKYSGDCSLYSVQAPSSAPVNITEDWKMLGMDKIVRQIPEIVVSGDTYDPVCRQYLAEPYFKGMFVDRRLDYDLTIIGPLLEVPSDAKFIYPDEKEKITTKKATHTRVIGSIYNGIEMAYDDDYNIITAFRKPKLVPRIEVQSVVGCEETTIEAQVVFDEVGSGEVVTRSHLLEYSYEYDSGYTNDVRTFYNSGGTLWKDYGDAINEKIKRAFPTSVISGWYYDESAYTSTFTDGILKTLYRVMIKDIDLRQLLWSNQNDSKMSNIVNNYGISNPSGYVNTWEDVPNALPFFLVNHNGESLINRYNGEFPSCYPTVRYLDVAKIEPSESFLLTLTSCNYELEAEFDESKSAFGATVGEGDLLELAMPFGTIHPSPRGEEEDYGHFIYIYPQNVSPRDPHTGEYTGNHYSGNTEIHSIGLGINYGRVSYDGMGGSAKPVRLMSSSLIREFKEQHTSDAMYSFYNTVKPDGKDLFPKLDVLTANNDLRVRELQVLGWDEYKEKYPYEANERDDNNIYFGENKLTMDDNYLLTCRIGATGALYPEEDEVFGQLTCVQNIWVNDSSVSEMAIIPDDISGFNESKFVTACAIRDLYSIKGDNLTKKVRVYEFSNLFDCRDIHAELEWKTEDINGVPYLSFSGAVFYDSDNKELKNIEDVAVEIWMKSTFKEGFSDGPSPFIHVYPKEYDLSKSSSKYEIKCTGDQKINLKEAAEYYANRKEVYTDKYTFKSAEVFSMTLYLTVTNGAIYKLIFGRGKNKWK